MDIYAKPQDLDADVVKNLGPLAPLAGTWEGDKGIDISPAKSGPVETKFRERVEFEPMGPVVNGPNYLYGLRYKMVAWPLGEEKAFHEELGYWHWDVAAKQVLRCFMVPRVVMVIAGADTDASAKNFKLKAELGSQTLGIVSTPFLDTAFQTVEYVCDLTINADGSFSYKEDTVLKLAGENELFHHTDENTLKKIS